MDKSKYDDQRTETPRGYDFVGQAHTPTQAQALYFAQQYLGRTDIMAVLVDDSFNSYTQSYEWDIYVKV